jgi:alpha-1,6-mannosyltransferase
MARAWAWLDGMPRPLVAGEPAAWMEVGAGAAMIVAVAIKASAAVLIPVILAGASRRIRVAMGMVIGLAAVAAATYVAFGVNLPNVSQQDQLVVPDGIPNLTGLALGFGGATSEMRTVLKLLLVLVVLGATIWTWRTRRWRSGCGWVTMALVLTLTWTLPWYILWLLPFAALARPRGLRVAVALIAVYTYLVFMPYSSEVLGFLHVNPANTNLGQQEQAYMNSLLF